MLRIRTIILSCHYVRVSWYDTFVDTTAEFFIRELCYFSVLWLQVTCWTALWWLIRSTACDLSYPIIFWDIHDRLGSMCCHVYVNFLKPGGAYLPKFMMTPSNGNIFRVTGHFCGEFTDHRWIPHTKASDAELLMFSLICARINGWVNNGEVGDLRRLRAHYDAIVMR